MSSASKKLLMPEWAVVDDAMSRQEAEAWIAKHPFQNQSKFWRQAERLGPDSVPGMIAVLADGPAEYHMRAAMVLTLNGVELSRGGDDPGSEWELTFANGDRRTVKPHYWIESDSDFDPGGESPPTLDAAAMRKLLSVYEVMFIVSAALAIGTYATDGVLQVILAVVAGLIFAVALWSTAFMIVARLFQRGVQRAFPDMGSRGNRIQR
jgi:hypothetical protein